MLTELEKVRRELPIFQHRDGIINAALEYQILVVVGDTGSGKTTQFPQYLYETNPTLRIAVTQPRRIAAISAANRVAEETASKLGGPVVGYSIRFDSVKSTDTKIVYMTDGTLLRTAAATDPTLETIADVVILDEAHERSLETDVLFGLLRKACKERPQLRLVVMSATLNVEKFSTFFNDAPVYVIPGRMFQVDIFYARKIKMASLKTTFIQKSVETAMQVHKNEEPGDILIFLTGQQDIETVCRLIKAAEEEIVASDIKYHPKVRRISLHPIYSALDTPEQRDVFNPAREGFRKIVVATNIAQTSVTIPGIRYVIDSGFVKEKMFDPRANVDALLVVPISKAAATQRAGRAGRTTTGKVFRLYSKDAFDSLDEDTTPEIQRSSLLGTVLSLKRMGITDVLGFEFIDPPEKSLIISALKQLYYLGALDDIGNLTSVGEKMADFPTSPFISRGLIAACDQYSCGEEFITLAAMLSSEDPFLSPRADDKKAEAEIIHASFGHPSGDHLAMIRLYNQWEKYKDDRDWCRNRYLRTRALRSACNVREQLRDTLLRQGFSIRSCRLSSAEISRRNEKHSKGYRSQVQDYDLAERNLDDFDHIPILKAVCAGFFVNTAKRHPQLPLFYHYLSSSGLNGSDGKHSAGSSTTDSQSALLSLYIHPGSSLSTVATNHVRTLDWIIYNDVQFVTRANLRIVSRIDFAWVEEALKRVSSCNTDKLLKIPENKTKSSKKRRLSAADAGDSQKKQQVDTNASNSDKGKEQEEEPSHGAPSALIVSAESLRLAKITAAKERYMARKK
ncbi:DEAH-box ATP-dependent RNA helicase prp22 [Phlyctochytrium planicorne]|nr:DEAH-box ATP-dependent RNA helicase prp22 [Phlyctochytrium planicorne]